MRYKQLRDSSRSLSNSFRIPAFIAVLIIVLITVIAMIVYISTLDHVDFKFTLKLRDLVDLTAQLTRS